MWNHAANESIICKFHFLLLIIFVYCPRRTTGNSLFTLEDLNFILLLQTEAFLSPKPLSTLSNEQKNLQLLTQVHFQLMFPWQLFKNLLLKLHLKLVPSIKCLYDYTNNIGYRFWIHMIPLRRLYVLYGTIHAVHGIYGTHKRLTLEEQRNTFYLI